MQQYKRLLALSILLLVLPLVSQADIYVFVDSNGVRHISNKPDDPRYKLVMKTPTYKAPEPKLTARETAAGNDVADVIAMTNAGTGWKLITPGGASFIKWGKFGGIFRDSGRPFAVNEANRKRYSPYVAAVAREHRLDPALVHAVISAESAYNPQAVSRAGAMGLMQLMPATAKRFGVNNPFDPVANMRGGARYLRILLDQFKNVNLAVAAYNAGEGAVSRYGNRIPPYEETQTYVSRVLRFYHHYRNIN